MRREEKRQAEAETKRRVVVRNRMLRTGRYWEHSPFYHCEHKPESIKLVEVYDDVEYWYVCVDCGIEDCS